MSEPASILLSSESEEWYTPTAIVEAARSVMGSIDLDPASCEEANRTVKARRFYTREQDGLSLPWDTPAVWLNPPYGRDEDHKSNQATWTARLVNDHNAGRVEQACALVNAMTGNKWFRPLWAFPICFVDGRIKFVAPIETNPDEKKSPTHSSCVVYFGPNVERFVRVFSRLGHVVTPDRVARDEAQRRLL